MVVIILREFELCAQIAIYLIHHYSIILLKKGKQEHTMLLWNCSPIQTKLIGLKKQILKTSVCFYTVTEDSQFLIEAMDGDKNFLWVSACSGHGFKHSAALGEDLVKRLGY